MIALGLVLNALHCLSPGVALHGQSYWYIGYGDGFIRRGLIGTIFQWLERGQPMDAQATNIVTIVSIVLVAIAALVVMEGERVAQRSHPEIADVVRLGVCLVLLSRLLPTLANLAGFLDPFLLLIGLGGFALIARGRYAAAAVLTALGPLVHEAFVFAWLPVIAVRAPVIVEALRGRPRRGPHRRQLVLEGLVLAVPLVSTALTMALQSPSAARAQILAMPLSDYVKEGMLTIQFGMTAGQFVRRVLPAYAEYPDNFFWCIPMFVLAAPILAYAAVRIDTARPRVASITSAIAATCTPLAVLLIAWDLTRFMVWSVYGAWIALLAASERRADIGAEDGPPSLAAPTRVAVAGVLASVFLASGPHMQAYLDVCYADLGPLPAIVRDGPAARLATAFMLFYNPRRYRTQWAVAGKELCPAATNDGGTCGLLRDREGFFASERVQLAPGTYVATVDVDDTSECHAPRGRAVVRSLWRFGGDRGEQRIDAGGRAEVRFTVTREEAAMGTFLVELRSDPDACVRFRAVRFDPAR